MAIRVRCTHCRQPYEVPQERLGREIVCPKCQKSFVLETPHRETRAEASQAETVKAPISLRERGRG